MRLGLTLWLFAAAALAYEPVKVTHGGRIEGMVRFSGRPPVTPSRALPPELHGDCGTATVPDESLLVGSGGGLANVVLTLEGIDRGKAAPAATASKLDNRGCRFVPHVQAVMAGQKLMVLNSDPIAHTVHAYSDDTSVFTLPLPIQGQQVPKRLPEPGVITVQCDAGHSWMRAYVVVAATPYVAVSDANGRFSIEDVPAGSYTLRAWHETLGERTTKLTVEPDAATTANFAFPR